MLRGPDEAYQGRVVYLYPHTRTAGQWCWKRKTAVVEDTRCWPRVHVTLNDGDKLVHAYPHKDDVRLRPPHQGTRDDQKQGDSVTTTEETTEVRVIPGRPVAKFDDQGTLW